MHLGKTHAEPQHRLGTPCPPLMHCWLHFQAVPCRTSHQQLLMVSPNAWLLACNSSSTDVRGISAVWFIGSEFAPQKVKFLKRNKSHFAPSFPLKKRVYWMLSLLEKVCSHWSCHRSEPEFVTEEINLCHYRSVSICVKVSDNQLHDYHPKFTAYWKSASS